MFGKRKREEAAALEAAREADRRALFAKLAERPEHICPFLGLDGERTGYTDGVSDDHRCFAFGDPAPISAEQQTRVCQERGYGNCPRYLRGVLVIPTEELDALRRPRPMEPIPPPAPAATERRRRGGLIPLVLGLLLLVGAGGAAWAIFGDELGTALNPLPSASASASASADVSATLEPTATPSPSEEPPPSAPPPSPSAELTPTPEPTPVSGDEFAFYEVSVGPDSYTLYLVGDDGSISRTRTVAFDGFSFARAAPTEGEDGALWVIEDGDLAGYAYQFPESGEFRVRAVFLSEAGDRRSFYLDASELDEVPEATPAPAP